MFGPDFSESLLSWGAAAGRDLPWRRTREPWPILVSELMLQQTQVSRVVPRYEAFLERFSDPSTCAASPLARVVEAWSGLGYNRRAVNLHRAAVVMVERHGGAVPDRLDELLALPGVGPYTARAVLAFSHERDVGVVDVNVGRLLARWTNSALKPAAAQRLADSLVPPGEAWRWNQALFDLGATICGARTPHCGICPAQPWCGWRSHGPDPAVGSAGSSSRQSVFEGSDRQGRGRLVEALRSRSIERDELPAVMGWPDDSERCDRVTATLIADGLVRESSDGSFSLPI